MKNIRITFLLVLYFAKITSAQNNGKSLFQMHCSSCHGISDGAFGPQLGGVHKLRSPTELFNFVANTNAALENPNVRTKALLDKYKTQMPSFGHLGKNKIIDILNYIKFESERLKVPPLTIATLLSKKPEKRYAPPIKPSKLYIELEDVVSIPRSKEHLDDKGITTLRSTTFGLFLSDQMGQIYSVSNNNATLYFDVAKNLTNFIVYPSIGAGLGSFAFHPNFAQNGLLYTTHNEKYAGQPAINPSDWPDSIGIEQQYVIDEWKTDTPAKFPFVWTKHREILRINTPTFAHSGQELTFVPNIGSSHPDYGLLYYGFGDGGTANIKQPQYANHLHSVLGSILRIDPLGTNGRFPSYGIPPDNPFVASLDPELQKEIYAFGFRNPYRFSWDNRRGFMYVADIGEANVEELNLVQKGGNYGWAQQEGNYGINVRIDKTVLFDRQDKGNNNTILPQLTYDHTDGYAISGGHIYLGKHKTLYDKYFFGDIVSGRLFFANADNMNLGVFDINIIKNSQETTIQELCGKKRTHLRIGYDHIKHEMYLLTKPDNTLRRIKNVFIK
jgi:glucose/arabinose dehydrogenase/cytochrome c2